MIKALRDNIRSYIISDILKQDLEKIKDEYRKKNNAELPPEKEAHFMEWKLREASSEADDMIEACVDEFIASKFRWLPFRNLSITGILILPAILTLTYYCIRHFSYLMGNQAAFEGLSFEILAGAIVSLLGLLGLLIASVVDELRKE
ncbi:MAG: hypothetical protein IJQ15_11380 [Synergistaceae bacterium]|nr:hypothetical protein [Synergistaceae bacterium]